MRYHIQKLFVLLFMVILPFQAQGYVHPNQAGHKGGDTTHAGIGSQVVTTTYYGNTGDITEQGVLFAVDKDGHNASSFHGFKGYPNDASYPWYTTPMQASDGQLYGVGFIGGSNNLGATYKYDMSTCSEEVISDNTLSPVSNEESPGNYANINELSDGKIYRADTYGGKFGLGAIIRMNKDGSDVEVIHDFTYGSAHKEDIQNTPFVQAVHDHLAAQELRIDTSVSYDGGYPYGFVVEGSDGKIYGTTLMGGYFTGGTVYSMNKDGSDYKILYMGDGYIRTNYYKDGKNKVLESAISSYYMWGNVAEGEDGNIYFSGYVGGENNLGAVSRIAKDGTHYQILHSASLEEGSTPYRGPLIIDDKLYQTYFTGGHGQGTIAQMAYDGSDYTNLYNFPADGSEGGQPRGGLAYDGEYLYGTTIIYGGLNSVGTLYKVKPNDGSSFETIHRFSNVAGGSCGGKAGLYNWFPSSERVTFADVNYDCSQTCIADANESLCGNGVIDTNITFSINPKSKAIGNIIDKVNNVWGVDDTHLVKDNGQWYVFDAGGGLLHLNKIDPLTGNTIAVGNIVDQVNNVWGAQFEVFNYHNQWYILDIAAGLAHLNKIDLSTGHTTAVGNLVDKIDNTWGIDDVKVFQYNDKVYVMDLGAGHLQLNELDPETGKTTAVAALQNKIDANWGLKFEVFNDNNTWYLLDVHGGATGASMHTLTPATGSTRGIGQLKDQENNYWGVEDIDVVSSHGKWFILDTQGGLLHVNAFDPATASTSASANMIDAVNNVWGVEFDTFVENNRLYIFDIGAGLGHLNVLELNGDGSEIQDETCDDGNTIDGDGCSSTCQLESRCGNGIVEEGESCDDNNTLSGDGCSSTCQIEDATTPDYSIAVYLNKTTIADKPTPVFIIITLSEILHGTNSGDLIFSITKNANLSINFDTKLMELEDTALKNMEWKQISETATSYQFKYQAHGGIFPSFTRMRIGLTGVYTPVALTRGKFILNARIKGKNGEKNMDNNKDSETMIYSNIPRTGAGK